MNTLNNILSFLDGKKTYITSIILAMYGVLKAFGLLDFTPDQELAVLALFGSLLGISLREAISKRYKK